jgi:MarR family transcriptional regulator, transcriptional regulator for hemolysin
LVDISIVDFISLDLTRKAFKMKKLGSTFFYNLEKAIKTYRQYFQNQLKSNGFDITLDQWLILHTVADYPGISQNDIAGKVFKDKASVTRIIELLVQNGYLDRAIHSVNRRMFQLSVTKKGIKTIEKLTGLAQTFRKTALTGIDAETFHTVQNAMKTITNNCKGNQ